MVSLLKLAEITEDGVTFESPKDGSRMLLTPEESIGIQNNLGRDASDPCLELLVLLLLLLLLLLILPAPTAAVF